MNKLRALVVVAAVAAGIVAVINKKKEDETTKKESQDENENEDEDSSFLAKVNSSQFASNEKIKTEYSNEEMIKRLNAIEEELLNEDLEYYGKKETEAKDTMSFKENINNVNEPLEKNKNDVDKTREENSSFSSMQQLFAATAGVFDDVETPPIFEEITQRNVISAEQSNNEILRESIEEEIEQIDWTMLENISKEILDDEIEDSSNNVALDDESGTSSSFGQLKEEVLRESIMSGNMVKDNTEEPKVEEPIIIEQIIVADEDEIISESQYNIPNPFEQLDDDILSGSIDDEIEKIDRLMKEELTNEEYHMKTEQDIEEVIGDDNSSSVSEEIKKTDHIKIEDTAVQVEVVEETITSEESVVAESLEAVKEEEILEENSDAGILENIQVDAEDTSIGNINEEVEEESITDNIPENIVESIDLLDEDVLSKSIAEEIAKIDRLMNEDIDSEDSEYDFSGIFDDDEYEVNPDFLNDEYEINPEFLDDDFLANYKFNDFSPEELEKYQIHQKQYEEEKKVEEQPVRKLSGRKRAVFMNTINNEKEVEEPAVEELADEELAVEELVVEELVVEELAVEELATEELAADEIITEKSIEEPIFDEKLEDIFTKLEDILVDDDEIEYEAFNFTDFNEEESVTIEDISHLNKQNDVPEEESEENSLSEIDYDVLDELLFETNRSADEDKNSERFVTLETNEDDELLNDPYDDEIASEIKKVADVVAKLADYDGEQKKNELVFNWEDNNEYFGDYETEKDIAISKLYAFSSRAESFQRELKEDEFIVEKIKDNEEDNYEYYGDSYHEPNPLYQILDVDWDLEDNFSEDIFLSNKGEEKIIDDGLKYLNQRRLAKESELEQKVIPKRSEKHQITEDYEVDPYWSYDDILMDQYIRQPYIQSYAQPFMQMNPFMSYYQPNPYGYMNQTQFMNPYQMNPFQMNPYNINPYQMNTGMGTMNWNPYMMNQQNMNYNSNTYPDAPVPNTVVEEEEIEEIQVKKKIVGTEVQKAKKQNDENLMQRQIDELVNRRIMEALQQQQAENQMMYKEQPIYEQIVYQEEQPVQNQIVYQEQQAPNQIGNQEMRPVLEQQEIIQEPAFQNTPGLDEYEVIAPTSQEQRSFIRDQRYPFIEESAFHLLFQEIVDSLNSYQNHQTLNVQHQILYFDPELQVKLIKEAKDTGYYCYIREDGFLLEKVMVNDVETILDMVLAMANRVHSEYSLYKGVSIFPNEQMN